MLALQFRFLLLKVETHFNFSLQLLSNLKGLKDHISQLTLSCLGLESGNEVQS